MEDNLSRKLNKRPSWDEFWFTQTLFYSTRGTCDRLRTACILVDDRNRFIAAGYNGALPRAEHCDDIGHLMIDGHCMRTLHAEENAILHASQDIRGATAYMLTSPCVVCMKKLLSCGINRILYAREFQNVQGKDEGWKFIHSIAQKQGAEIKKIDVDFRSIITKMSHRLEGGGGFFEKT